MRFRSHLELEGRHAFLSPSNYHWINYDDEKLIDRWNKHMDAQMGSRLHDLAKELILLGQKLPATSQTLNLYVNDCIGYGMTPEQPLYYSPNAFGTTDAIDFNEEQSLLRIFDLKNGVTPTKVTQLEAYTALFCLEYGVRPMEINYDLRIYQHDEVRLFETNPEDIVHIMSKIKSHDELINRAREVS